MTGRRAAQRAELRSRAARGAVALGIAGLALLVGPTPAGAQVVERVVDGDTIIVAGIGRVRLIGVDTPETVDPRRPVQFFGREASAFAKQLLEGKAVRLEYDQPRTDRYGRTLAYVWLPDGPMANREIIRRGYGHAYTRFPFRYLEEFRALEREARLAGHGLWGAEDSAPTADADAPSNGAAEWDDNGNGRVSCAEARRHGIAPVRRDHPAYAFMSDPDGDGVVCEGRAAASRASRDRPTAANSAASRWDDNGNGRISCAEARRHGIAPVRRGHPAYEFMNDPDGDGVVCEAARRNRDPVPASR